MGGRQVGPVIVHRAGFSAEMKGPAAKSAQYWLHTGDTYGAGVPDNGLTSRDGLLEEFVLDLKHD